ncbi:hypothetical protein AB0B89_14995 [Sphaerisporangium sp. NPDC049002]|uniref:hypothetical protein n=1 Tax=unclassified Sphaerisporangium TaxID=2630420 RepID=UPI00340D4EB0
MRRNVFAALALSGALAVPATLASAALAAAPSDELIKGGYESLASCQSALPDIEEQQSSIETSLVCKAYTEPSSATMWGVYTSTTTGEETPVDES